MALVALLLQLAGIVAIVVGIAMFSIPAAVICGGLGATAFGLLLERATTPKDAAS